MSSETVTSKRDSLLLNVWMMAKQVGETEACEFAVALYGTMVGQPLGAVRFTATGIEEVPLDPTKVHESFTFAQVTPVDYKLKFCIAEGEDCVYVTFNDLNCRSGMYASWRLGLDGVIHVLDYVLS